jgi:hypothetical protein
VKFANSQQLENPATNLAEKKKKGASSPNVAREFSFCSSLFFSKFQSIATGTFKV